MLLKPTDIVTIVKVVLLKTEDFIDIAMIVQDVSNFRGIIVLNVDVVLSRIILANCSRRSDSKMVLKINKVVTRQRPSD